MSIVFKIVKQTVVSVLFICENVLYPCTFKVTWSFLQALYLNKCHVLQVEDILKEHPFYYINSMLLRWERLISAYDNIFACVQFLKKIENWQFGLHVIMVVPIEHFPECTI